jgi:hypothetical protein
VTDVLLKFADFQWAQARQSEDQRATLTNFLIVIFIGLQGFIVNQAFAPNTLILAAVIIFVGIFGLLASAKYYERFAYSLTRVGEIMKHLDKIYQSTQLRELHKQADVEHNTKYPRLHKFRLHYIWNILTVSIALFGVIDLLIIVKAIVW